MRDQLGMLRQDTFDALGQFPTMMGEIGIPFDLDKKKAYEDGNYSSHTRALDASLNACDGANALNYSIWTYCPDNSHSWGDLWNGEDLSIWSVDDAARMGAFRAAGPQLDLVGKIPSSRARANSKASSQSSLYSSRASTPSGSSLLLPMTNGSSARLGTGITPKASLASLASTTLTVPSPASFTARLPLSSISTSSLCDPFLPINLNDGARAIAAFCRPYPMKTVGTPVDINFDIRTSVFTLTVRLDAGDVADPNLPTEVFLPLVQYAAYPSRVSQRVRDDLQQREQFAEPTGDSPGEEKDASGDPYGTSLSLPDESYADDLTALALKVTVSAGRWETEGQVLRWYYPRPATGSVTLKLEVSRLNGAIPTWLAEFGASTAFSSPARSLILTTSGSQDRTPTLGKGFRLAKELMGAAPSEPGCCVA